MGYYKIQIKLHAFLFREERIRAQLELDPKKHKIQKYKQLGVEHLELTPEPLDSRSTGQSHLCDSDMHTHGLSLGLS